MNRKIFCAAALSAALVLSGCGKQAAPEVKPPLVRTQTVAQGASARTAEYAGNVRGRYEKNMAFQVGGQIVARSVQLGDRVTAGTVMMRIDPKDVAQKTAAADAQAESAGAQLALDPRPISDGVRRGPRRVSDRCGTGDAGAQRPLLYGAGRRRGRRGVRDHGGGGAGSRRRADGADFRGVRRA